MCVASGSHISTKTRCLSQRRRGPRKSSKTRTSRSGAEESSERHKESSENRSQLAEMQLGLILSSMSCRIFWPFSTALAMSSPAGILPADRTLLQQKRAQRVLRDSQRKTNYPQCRTRRVPRETQKKILQYLFVILQKISGRTAVVRRGGVGKIHGVCVGSDVQELCCLCAEIHSCDDSPRIMLLGLRQSKNHLVWAYGW